jgi:hypothetical protein
MADSDYAKEAKHEMNEKTAAKAMTFPRSASTPTFYYSLKLQRRRASTSTSTSTLTLTLTLTSTLTSIGVYA